MLETNASHHYISKLEKGTDREAAFKKKKRKKKKEALR